MGERKKQERKEERKKKRKGFVNFLIDKDK